MKLVAAPPRTFSTQRAFHDHAPDLYRYAYWLSTNAEDARDLVQDAFVGLVNRQQRSDQTPVGDVRAYLFTSVRNAFYQSLRRGSSTETYSDDALEADSDDTIDRLPEQALLLDEQRRSVRQAVERLTPRHRRVLALREVEGLSYA